MSATGIPQHLVLTNKVIELSDRIDQLEGGVKRKLNDMETNIND